MRIKIFTSDTVTNAMRQIRDELGDNAVIISTQTDDETGGVRITAALEVDDHEGSIEDLLVDNAVDAARDEILQALDYHGVPRGLSDPMIAGLEGNGMAGAEDGLEVALRRRFEFEPLTLASLDRPVILVGAPGSGKTTSAARLATRATVENRNLSVITTDSFRAGAREQLAAFTDILETQLTCVDGAEELQAALDSVPRDAITIIDTTGANPFNAGEMAALARLIETSGAEPVLVFAAGGDVAEAAEIATCFGALGVRRMVATQLDIARRLGAAIAAAEAGPFAFSDVSFSPQVARGMKPLTPQALARLVLRDPSRANTGLSSEKALVK